MNGKINKKNILLTVVLVFFLYNSFGLSKLLINYQLDDLISVKNIIRIDYYDHNKNLTSITDTYKINSIINRLGKLHLKYTFDSSVTTAIESDGIKTYENNYIGRLEVHYSNDYFEPRTLNLYEHCITVDEVQNESILDKVFHRNYAVVRAMTYKPYNIKDNSLPMDFISQ